MPININASNYDPKYSNAEWAPRPVSWHESFTGANKGREWIPVLEDPMDSDRSKKHWFNIPSGPVTRSDTGLDEAEPMRRTNEMEYVDRNGKSKWIKPAYADKADPATGVKRLKHIPQHGPWRGNI